MVKDKYLIVGQARIGAAFDWNAALQSLLSAGASYAVATAQANAQQKAFEAAQAQAAANAAAGIPTGTRGMMDNIVEYLPYIAIGGVLLVLLMKKR